jgi:hypothetical protein
VNREAAEASQLMIEYDPEPPFDSGDLAKASEATHQLALEFYQHPLLSVLPRQAHFHRCSRRSGGLRAVKSS